MEGSRARRRRRQGNDMEETTQLPCEPSLVLGQTLFQLYMQLAVTVCASDACATRRHAPPHYKRARRELWRLAAPRLQDAYENALNEVSELGALSVLVDAYLLRYMLATRCALPSKRMWRRREDGDERDAIDSENVKRLVLDAVLQFLRVISLRCGRFRVIYAIRQARRGAFYGGRGCSSTCSGHDDEVASIDASAPDWAHARTRRPTTF